MLIVIFFLIGMISANQSCFSKKLKCTLGPNWHKDPGCKAQPLLDIPLDHVIVDELHMFLRVTDILEKGVILEVINWDEVKHYRYI